MPDRVGLSVCRPDLSRSEAVVAESISLDEFPQSIREAYGACLAGLEERGLEFTGPDGGQPFIGGRFAYDVLDGPGYTSLRAEGSIDGTYAVIEVNRDGRYSIEQYTGPPR